MPSAALADEEESGEIENRFAVGVFLGATRAHEEYENTLGLELGYRLHRNWSIGFVAERAEREKDTTLLLAGVGWHPYACWRLQLGVGRKDPSGSHENVVRAGLAYEWELPHSWFIKPYAAMDFIEHEEDEPVLGAYFGRGF